jgi:hypothetical protein
MGCRVPHIPRGNGSGTGWEGDGARGRPRDPRPHQEHRVAASTEALHDRVDPLARKGLALIEAFLEVHAEIGRQLDASEQAAAEYSKASGVAPAPVGREHGYLAMADELARTGEAEDDYVRPNTKKIKNARKHRAPTTITNSVRRDGWRARGSTTPAGRPNVSAGSAEGCRVGYAHAP